MDLFSPTPIYSCWSSPSSLPTKQINIFPTRLYRFCGTFLVGQFPEMLLSSSEEKSSLPINNMFCVPSASVSELFLQRDRRFWSIPSRAMHVPACSLGLFSREIRWGGELPPTLITSKYEDLTQSFESIFWGITHTAFLWVDWEMQAHLWPT